MYIYYIHIYIYGYSFVHKRIYKHVYAKYIYTHICIYTHMITYTYTNEKISKEQAPSWIQVKGASNCVMLRNPKIAALNEEMKVSCGQ